MLLLSMPFEVIMFVYTVLSLASIACVRVVARTFRSIGKGSRSPASDLAQAPKEPLASSPPAGPQEHVQEVLRFVTVNLVAHSDRSAEIRVVSRELPMVTDAVKLMFMDLEKAFDEAAERGLKLAVLYDFRSYSLPGIKESMLRVRELLRWINSREDFASGRIHTVAIVMPSSASVLSKFVHLVLSTVRARCAPRVFRGHEGLVLAQKFVRERVDNVAAADGRVTAHLTQVAPVCM